MYYTNKYISVRRGRSKVVILCDLDCMIKMEHDLIIGLFMRGLKQSFNNAASVFNLNTHFLILFV